MEYSNMWNRQQATRNIYTEIFLDLEVNNVLEETCTSVENLSFEVFDPPCGVALCGVALFFLVRSYFFSEPVTKKAGWTASLFVYLGKS